MNKQTKKAISNAMIELLASRNGYLQCESARILCAIENIYVTESITSQTPSKVTAELALARQTLAEKINGRRQKKKLTNRKYYLRKRLAELEAQNNNQETNENSRSTKEGIGRA
jgi:hypothetical protein